MALVEHRLYTALEQTHAQRFFEQLASQPDPHFPERTALDSYRMELQRLESVGGSEAAKQLWQAQLRREPGTKPLMVRHNEQAALIIASELPMPDAITLYRDRLQRELATQQELLPLAASAPDPEAMRVYIQEKIDAGKRRLTEFNEALEDRRTGPSDTY